MTWTYRVMRDERGRYSIREVFYERDGTITTYSREPVSVVDASLADLAQLLQWFNEALDLPVLSTLETDALIAAQDRQRPSGDNQNVPLSRVLAEIEATAQVEPAAR